MNNSPTELSIRYGTVAFGHREFNHLETALFVRVSVFFLGRRCQTLSKSGPLNFMSPSNNPPSTSLCLATSFVLGMFLGLFLLCSARFNVRYSRLERFKIYQSVTKNRIYNIVQ